MAAPSEKPKWVSESDPFPTQSAPGQSADKARSTGGFLPRPFLAWAAAALVLLAVCTVGWIYSPVRPEPFEDPPPPLSLDWWIYTPADPGIADLDMVPVGRFGSFLPREVARNIRANAAFTIKGIADAFVLPDGKEIAVSLYEPLPPPASRAVVFYSEDGGKTWLEAPIAKIQPCGAPGQSLKVQRFEPRAANFAIDCFPTSLPDSTALNAGPATTSVVFSTGTKGDGLWLTTEMGPVWIANGGSKPFKVPNKELPTLVRPQPNNHILVASADGFVTLSAQQVQLSGPPPLSNESSASRKGDGSAAIPPNVAAPPNLPILAPSGEKFGTETALPQTLNRTQNAEQEPAQVQQRPPAEKTAPVRPPTAKPVGKVQQLPLTRKTAPLQPPTAKSAGELPLPAQDQQRPPDEKTAPVQASTAKSVDELPLPAQVQQRPPDEKPSTAEPTSELTLPAVGALTAIRDPKHPDRNAPIRTMRVSNDGKSVVVAQNVARDTGVLVSHDAGQSWSRLGYATAPAPWVVFIAFPLAVMAAAAAARQLIRTPAGELSIADEAATDRPIGLYDVDALQFEPIARGLLMFIRNPQTEPPVTIAITGPWGSGKTSLMTILRDLLREHDARPVWFNAWHHQKEEHLLAALLENIRQQAIPSIGTWAGLFFRLRLLRRRLAGRLGVLLVLFAAALFVIGSYLSLSEQTTKELQTWLSNAYVAATDKKPEQGVPPVTKGQKAEGDWLLALIALLPSGLAVPVLLVGILKNLQAFPRAKPEQLLSTQNKDKSGFAGKLSFRYRFEREFRETAAALRSSTSPGLVVFIDDLDRCHAQNVVELLEAINFIVSAGDCFVVVGMAKEQIWRSILASYKSEFLSIPKEAVRGGDVETARRRFADRYLEKLINIEVPVPQASAGQIKLLLTGAAKRPDLPPGVALRRRLRFVYDNGPVILLAGFLVALFIWAHPYLARLSLYTPVPPPIADTMPSKQNNPQAVPAADFTVPQVYASDEDLPGAAPRAGFPWAQLALALALLAAASAYLARLWVLSKQRPASDSQPFREALDVWTSVIFLASRTPRAVKQYKNMLRYQAMRLRALQATGEAKANILEPDLVALGAISLVDRALLTGAIPPGGKSLETLVKDAAVKALPDDRVVFDQISASLDKRQRAAGRGTSAASLEFSIGQYLALLPAAV
jgi:KAP family P-loop domain